MTLPRVTLKLATSLDGRIAAASGESRWITGEAAREQVHRLRAQHQMILVGIGTALADDPELTVRLPGYVGQQPARVVLDSRQRLPVTSKLVQTAHRIPTIVVAATPAREDLLAAGVVVIAPETVSAERLDPDEIIEVLPASQESVAAQLEALAESGVVQIEDVKRATRTGEPFSLLIEGGGQVAASFLKAGLVDAIEWFRAPIVLGDEGRPAVGAMEINALGDAPRFRRVAVEELGPDLWERYERP